MYYVAMTLLMIDRFLDLILDIKYQLHCSGTKAALSVKIAWGINVCIFLWCHFFLLKSAKNSELKSYQAWRLYSDSTCDNRNMMVKMYAYKLEVRPRGLWSNDYSYMVKIIFSWKRERSEKIEQVSEFAFVSEITPSWRYEVWYDMVLVLISSIESKSLGSQVTLDPSNTPGHLVT